jgi:glycosyltransferase involved in cell wall biosynthesis
MTRTAAERDMTEHPRDIAMISLYLPGNSKIGSGWQAHYMANALVQHGHRVTMFSPDRPGEGARYDYRRVDVGRKLKTFRFAWNLRKAGLEDFDLIHAHGDDYWLWGKRFPPHVRTMHGSCLAEARHVPSLKGKLRMFMLGLSELLATRVADRTVCISRDTCRYYPGVDQVIVNGVDLEAFHPCPPQDKESRPTILFVGTYHNRKRGKLLMEQFADVIRPAIPDAQLWMVCGDAPSAAGIEVLGNLSIATLADRYRRATVFCLPSSYEGFGVPYIEAMASGTPVVATPNPGALEVLDNGRYGRIVEPHELGQALLALLQDAEQQRTYRESGLERAARYGWERIVQSYEAMYEAIKSDDSGRRFAKGSQAIGSSSNVS